MLPVKRVSIRDGNDISERRAKKWPNWLIDCEEDRPLRAVLVGMLREAASRPTRPKPLLPTVGSGVAP
jgi:hypothetical protein